MKNSITELAMNSNAEIKGSSNLDAADHQFSKYNESPSPLTKATYNESPSPLTKATYDESPSTLHRTTYDESPSTLVRSTFYSDTSSLVKTDIVRVAEWFLTHAPMSHKKLQKLCYYAYAWFLVFFNDQENMGELYNKICTEGFEAWVHGPVNSELYNHYKKYGWDDIPMVSQQPQFPTDVNDLLEQVWNTYGTFSADQLEQLSHSELPWREARVGLEPTQPSSIKINDNYIFQYYSDMMNNEKESNS